MSHSKSSSVNKNGTQQSFVSRWSSLKHQAKQDVDSATVDADKSTEQLVPDKLVPDKEVPAKVLTDKDMPDIKTMTADSDYTGFMSPGVSEKLRRLALRKLFHSEGFNIRDGLDEYDGDYTQFEALGDIVTSDMHYQIELEAKRKAEQMLENNESPDEPLEEKVNRVDSELNETEGESVDENIAIEAMDNIPQVEADEVEDTLINTRQTDSDDDK